MGTSSSYGGPGKGGTLLPPWADPAPASVPAAAPDGPQPTAEPQPAPTLTWAGAKARLTRFGTSSGSSTAGGRRLLRRAASGYVRAQGGPRAATRNAVAGRRSAQALGGFLGTVISSGAEQAFRFLGLQDHVGSDAVGLLGALVDRLASNGHGLEDNVARSAMTKTLHALFDEQGVTDGGLAALGEMTAADAQAVIAEYVARYVNERLLQVMGDGLQSVPTDDLVKREAEVWDYIRTRAQLDLRDVDVLQLDWGGAAAAAVIERIFTEAHRLLERP